jgi:hypothetical protein
MTGVTSMQRLLAAAVLATTVTLVAAGGTAAAEPHSPTCAGTLGIVVHGQHIVGDYVTGIGHTDLAWPPSGGVVGQTVATNGGVAIAGGPGPGFHFPNGFAPGASFCNGSSSPGRHL